MSEKSPYPQGSETLRSLLPENAGICAIEPSRSVRKPRPNLRLSADCCVGETGCKREEWSSDGNREHNSLWASRADAAQPEGFRSVAADEVAHRALHTICQGSASLTAFASFPWHIKPLQAYLCQPQREFSVNGRASNRRCGRMRESLLTPPSSAGNTTTIEIFCVLREQASSSWEA